MKTLLLLRHAKSSRKSAHPIDFDRPLAPRGITAAPRMGREITRRGWVPDLALVSAARRSMQSWELFSAALPRQPTVNYSETLYEAPVDSLLAELRQLPDDVQSVLLLGHNPGLQELAISIAGPGSDQHSLSMLTEKFPTSALARFAFEGSWGEFRQQSARLTEFVRPRDLD